MPVTVTAGLLAACRVPDTIAPGNYGPWQIRRFDVDVLEHPAARAALAATIAPFRTFTFLGRHTLGTLMRDVGEGVMDDTPTELRRHLPILLRARGRVLVTGLGLGCVVRGLLARPEVVHIDVVEIDTWILRVIGPEFAQNPRVTLHQGDALSIRWPADVQWDYAWHDLWSDEESWDVLHGRLLVRYDPRCPRQGAWQFPRALKRRWPRPLLGAPRRRLVAA